MAAARNRMGPEGRTERRRKRRSWEVSMRAMGLLGMLGLLLAGCGERAPDPHTGPVAGNERVGEADAPAPKPGRDPRVMLQGAGRAPVRIAALRLENGVATLRDKRTGIRWQISATAVKAH